MTGREGRLVGCWLVDLRHVLHVDAEDCVCESGLGCTTGRSDEVGAHDGEIGWVDGRASWVDAGGGPAVAGGVVRGVRVERAEIGVRYHCRGDRVGLEDQRCE